MSDHNVNNLTAYKMANKAYLSLFVTTILEFFMVFWPVGLSSMQARL